MDRHRLVRGLTVKMTIAAVFLLLAMPAVSHADDTDCDASSTFHGASAGCRKDPGEVRDAFATAADDGFTYRLESRCKVGGKPSNCPANATCTIPGGRQGLIYLIYRRTDATGEEIRFGDTCLSPGQYNALETITPAMVRREFERLSWPTSELQLQPPDGQTLINFDTNFFTDNTTPTTRTVTLLGQRVEIEATPTSYTWDFGDGTSTTTSSPGAAYPDLDVTHDYADPGRVSPSVATTYQGRYRINGGGWQQIPGSLTLEGEPESLRVRSASPRLVGTSY
jgi:hypothetical protein